MTELHRRSLVQTGVILAILGLAQYTPMFESSIGQILAGLVLVLVGVDVVWMAWRRFYSSG